MSSAETRITYWSDPGGHETFQTVYMRVRRSEGRILPDDEVAVLPHVARGHPHKDEWTVRKHSTGCLLAYLASQHRPIRLLDLGCGNGWLSHQLSTIEQSQVDAVDINQVELSQAATVFGHKENLRFVFGDILEGILLHETYDYIVLASAIQYFESLAHLLERLFDPLKSDGEIHILDSPLYAVSEVLRARERTDAYYQSIGIPEMAGFYHHHAADALRMYRPSFLYKPSRIRRWLKSLVSDTPYVPFPWIRIAKSNVTVAGPRPGIRRTQDSGAHG